MMNEEMRDFLSACGSSGPFVLGVEEPGTSGISWRVFDKPFLVVGCDPGADLFLKDPEVSRRHAYLQLIAGRLFAVDLQSRTGTHWGDDPGIWGWVQRGRGIRIGPYRLSARDDTGRGLIVPQRGEPTLPMPISRAFEQPDLTEAVVEVIDASGGSHAWRVSRTMALIGSSRACKIRLQAGGIADVHASLMRTPSGLFVIDLLGRGGTFVNGHSVRCARLEGGDEISVGTYRIRIRYSTPVLTEGALGTTGSIQAHGRSVTTPHAREFRPGEDTVSLVKSMLDEFGQIQLQMADRFQESMMAVLRSFAGFHGEQMVLIREELARIQELTEEQQALRSRVEGRGQLGPGPPPSTTSPPLVTNPIAHPLEAGYRARDPVIRADDLAPSRVGEARACPPGPHPVDLHGQIVSRIAEIQDERQGRVQKLLKGLLG